MVVVLYIAAILLALVYLGAGLFKLVAPRSRLKAIPPLGWVEDFSAGQVKLIGAVEVLGALGVILPLLTGIAPVLTGIAALGLVIVQVVAALVHRRREEAIVVNIVIAMLALIVTVARFVTL